jgi:peptide/nickel transport system permease protein
VTQMVLAPTPEDAAAEVGKRRPLKWVWDQVRSRPSAVVGAIVFVLIVFGAVFAPLLAQHSPYQQFGTGYASPTLSHPLGLDDGGYDLWAQVLYGTRTSLIVGFAASILAMVIGTVLGLAAGYYGRGTDASISSVTDFFLVIPEVPLMMVLATLALPVIGQKSTGKTIFIIGILLWTWTVRVIRSQVMSVKERVYVRRAKALGGTNWRIITRHVMPQVAPLIIVNFVLTVAVAVFDESALAFLGLGDPTVISLGRILDNANQGGAASLGAWWALLPAGFMIVLIILSLTLMGSAVEDALNPRLKVSYLARRHFLLLPNKGTGSDRPGRPTPPPRGNQDVVGEAA